MTNLKESPALLAADAAEAARRGFAEIETTVGVARYAPLNAIALLVGSQTGRPGVMTQCAVEERRNLELAIRGLVTYAETLSVYGTEPVFVDGDDTPWSKAFLGAAYASRGVKVRFTSGTGSEALMGYAQGLSMLYLEARCLAVVRAAGSQGVQNGSISCVALVLSVPGGTRAILGENVLAAWLDLEVASGNDAIASHSEIRKTAKLMGQFLPGRTSSRPATRSCRATTTRSAAATSTRTTSTSGSRSSATGRSMQASSRSRRRSSCACASARRARCRPCSRSSGFRRSRTTRSPSRRPATTRARCPTATGPRTSRRRTTCSRAASRGSTSPSRSTARVRRRRRGRAAGCSGSASPADYLQTSAVIDADGVVRSAVNDPNEYPAQAPATASRASGGSSSSASAGRRSRRAARRHGGRGADRRRAWTRR